MNNLGYYASRFGLLGVIVVLGLVAFFPDVLPTSSILIKGKQQAEYLDGVASAMQEDLLPHQLEEHAQLIAAINEGLSTATYIFSKNKYKIYNQRDWWPPLYEVAINADDVDVFKFLLDKGYGCEYRNPDQGLPAFKSAANADNPIFFELLLENNCETEPAQFRPKLKALVEASKYPLRVSLLERQVNVDK